MSSLSVDHVGDLAVPVKRTIYVPLDSCEWRNTGDPTGNETTLRGHAAVFNSLSEDLGGFRELIEPGFFRDALRRKPDVRLLFNHDPNKVMARTASGTLELREDQRGLHVFATVDKRIVWTKDLRLSMQRGDIDQMSFAFTLKDGGDDWAVTDDGTVIRTLRQDGADELFDTSVVTYPAYKATEVSMRSVLDEAIEQGRIDPRSIPFKPGGLLIKTDGLLSLGTDVAAEPSLGESAPADVALETGAGESAATDVALADLELVGESESLSDLRTYARDTVQAEKTEYLRLLGRITK
jgi:HK97 family phage prohead protease